MKDSDEPDGNSLSDAASVDPLAAHGDLRSPVAYSSVLGWSCLPVRLA